MVRLQPDGKGNLHDSTNQLQSHSKVSGGTIAIRQDASGGISEDGGAAEFRWQHHQKNNAIKSAKISGQQCHQQWQTSAKMKQIMHTPGLPAK